MIISPRGEVLGRLPADQPAVLRAVIDTEAISGWYLSQRRTDLLGLRYQARLAAYSPSAGPVPSAAAPALWSASCASSAGVRRRCLEESLDGLQS